jgi:SAM-dependent methyltransferase
MSELARVEQDAWTHVSSITGASFEGTSLVRGPGAPSVGEALLALGSTTVIAQELITDPDRTDPPDDVVDTVVLLHAWDGTDKVDEAAKAAVGWLKPGGWLVLADLAVDALVGAPPELYPSALLYQRFPATADYLATRSASAVRLATAAVRAGLDDKASAGIDRPVGAYNSPSEFEAAVEFGAWRGLDRLSRQQYAELVTAVGEIPIAEWPLVETEPWVVVAGSARV